MAQRPENPTARTGRDAGRAVLYSVCSWKSLVGLPKFGFDEDGGKVSSFYM